MSPCLYTRKVPAGYEYGYCQILNTGTKQEKREHIPKGVKPTMEEALAANQMAAKGLPRIGVLTEPAPWSYR